MLLFTPRSSTIVFLTSNLISYHLFISRSHLFHTNSKPSYIDFASKFHPNTMPWQKSLLFKYYDSEMRLLLNVGITKVISRHPYWHKPGPDSISTALISINELKGPLLTCKYGVNENIRWIEPTYWALISDHLINEEVFLTYHEYAQVNKCLPIRWLIFCFCRPHVERASSAWQSTTGKCISTYLFL